VRGPARLDARGTARLAVRPAPALVSAAVVDAVGRLEMGDPALMLASELAAMADGLPEGERGALALLVLASLLNLSRGSTRLPLGDAPEGLLAGLLMDLGATPEERAAVTALAGHIADGAIERLAPILGDARAYRPLAVEGGCLYHQRTLALEDRAAAALAERLGGQAADPAPVMRALDDVLRAPSFVNGRAVEPSGEQRAAVVRALTSPLTVISGGPGTGKTAVVVTLLRTLARWDEAALDKVALAAPTGRAADRMRQSVAASLHRVRSPAFVDGVLMQHPPPALTLHRLLGYSPRSGRFRHHRNNPLAARFVLVDESSMIDLALMDRLLGALAPDARLVLLGDAQQLPSVDAGAVFRDLCRVGGDRAAHLSRSYRMDPEDPEGRNVLSIALRMNEGDVDGMFAPNADSAGVVTEAIAVRRADEVTFAKVELVEGSSARARDALLERWWAHLVEALDDAGAKGVADRVLPLVEGRLAPEAEEEVGRLFAQHERFRILCLTHARPTGVAAVNGWFHARMAAGRAGGADVSDPLPGEPVIVLRNDYERRLFNGDQGLVIRTDGGKAAVFRRDGGFVLFPFDSVRSSLELAWAVTVHKAQGSEYDHVAVILPDTETPLLHRELLYTAVTRSRRSVLLVGPRAMLAHGVKHPLQRESGIADRIAQRSTGEASAGV
jgi:exodeoxyribonuclease V alpha subunit